ncbi:MAG: glutamyl-tRNA reductase [Candidatus Omnitrophica bacterium]|nr:glutamyl-tRNA reductase [Candidatus Omnitrophota bacterium]
MLIIGLNHKTAPIEVREKFFLNPAQQDLLLLELKNNPLVNEAFVLSTCNRVEVYLKRSNESIDRDFVVSMIAKVRKTSVDSKLTHHVYSYENTEAVEHLFRVATGLDSLVLGEKQILGQLKHSVDRARELGLLSRYFNILSNVAIRTGKKAQTETDISFGGSSVSWAAIEMAKQTLGTLAEKSVLIIGAGKMGELALTNLNNHSVSKIYLMNRTGEKADVLAQQYRGIAVSFWDIKDILTEVDLCFCSVGAPHYILDQEKMAQIMALRRGRRLVLVDISMPRNIDPAVAQIPNVHLSSIDALDGVVQANMKKRQEAISQVKEIISQKIVEFNQKWEKLQSLNDSDFFEITQS